MSFVTVLATSDSRIEKLVEHRVNSLLISTIKDLGSFPVEIEHRNYGGPIKIESPISVVVVGLQTLYVSGTADELEARFRL